MISKLSFKISNKDSNKSISSFLSAFYLGKEKIYKLELNSCLFINDEKAFTRSILKENDILTIIIDEEINVAPCGDDLEVVYEDEHFLFVNKPKNMLVHDDGTKQEITLSNLVAKYYKNKRIHRMVRFSNRLDYETSGIVVFSKNEIAHAYLDALIRERKVSKKYYAEIDRVENNEDVSLFIKNIENVQGDERDIIIFSTAYAKDERGR